MPLKGLRVVELGTLPAASYCARLFADFGAEVLKIEPPAGDPTRHAEPLVDLAGDISESGYFGFLNFNKRSVVLDATSKADADQLRELMTSADVLIDSLDAAARNAFQIDHAALRMSNEALVIADISWFGNNGPYRDYKATDSVCRALAGLVQLVGPEQGPPVPVEDYQGVPVGGLTAFIASMVALQDTTGRGGTFEISLHEANLAVADYNVALAWAGGAADKRWGVNRFAPNYPLGIHRCKSGWIGVTVVTPVQWKTFCHLLDVADLASNPAYAVNRGRLANADVIEARFAPQFLQRTAEEWFALALQHRLPFVVVPTMADLLSSPEHRRRGSFVPVRHGARAYEVPRSPLRLTVTPPKAGGVVPALGEGAPRWADEQRREPARAKVTKRLPLEGMRIVDLSMGWAGPQATRHFADLGCDVIKVEACQYPDWWRGVDNRPIVIEQMLYEKSSYFNVLNRNKRGITLDLTTVDGVRLVKELVRGADAVIENYSNGGVLPKLGLDYASLRQINPEIVMVSMPAFAADGEWSECRAYGSTLEQASGLPSRSGAPDGPPAMNHIAYGDPIGGLNAAAALLVAIFHRRRTNQGQHIDISQVECMLPMVAPWLIEQSANGTVAPRRGGRHPSCVPHGCFPCRGDDAWILIAVEDDHQWHALCGAIGRDDLKQDVSLATRAGRRLHEAAIEQAIATWTAKMTADDAMATLQHAGVAAGVARPPLELLDDPHLQARHFWQWIDRPFVGSHPQPSPAYRENGRPFVARHPAPTLGEYNIPVLRDILGLSQTEIDKLAAAGIIGTRAVAPNLRKARAAVG